MTDKEHSFYTSLTDMRNLILAQDVATGVCGALNASYFLAYWWRNGSRRRRVASVALVLLSGAAVAEAAFSQGLLWAGPASDGLWALARLPLFVATGFITVLIVRRMSG